ncbi:MAG: anaerobic benzoate catabolism transcriptional regulator [Spirochaetes bacterium ADurb.Bin315]|nr:MAG: anaerobic benzoate catabolism transcriptional regulator [Spirochaetes bacterium ADurb.Bin315]
MHNILDVMAKRTPVLLPRVERILIDLGERIRLARLRRNISAQLLADRAGISRQTLSTLENGSGSVSLATFIQVLFVLGLEKDLEEVAKDDVLGRKLQDLNLPTRRRATKRDR